MSLVQGFREPGEWRDRKIGVFGAVKSFIGQLKMGQELTRVSLPAGFLYPFGVLEVMAHHYLSSALALESVCLLEDPVDRMKELVKWYLIAIDSCIYERKPQNSILGENHYAYLDTPNGRVSIVCEQVSHHPPLAAFQLTHEHNLFRFEGQLEFGIKFHGNSVSIRTIGPGTVTLPGHGEVYSVEKVMPDIIMSNVVLGTRRMVWDNKAIITCEQSGCQAELLFKETGVLSFKNVVEGTINQGGSTEYSLSGTVLGSVNFLQGAQTKRKKAEVAETLEWEEQSRGRPLLSYLPSDQQNQWESLSVWRAFSEAVVADDLAAADREKMVIEDAQRKRRADGQDLVPQFFTQSEETQQWSRNATPYPNASYRAEEGRRSRKKSVNSTEGELPGKEHKKKRRSQETEPQ